ncbi:MAG: hypothetical protein OXI53_06520 [Nitrospira sp.]|nr:hypothetical protein [Nitrospira sp.]
MSRQKPDPAYPGYVWRRVCAEFCMPDVLLCIIRPQDAAGAAFWMSVRHMTAPSAVIPAAFAGVTPPSPMWGTRSGRHTHNLPRYVIWECGGTTRPAHAPKTV